jgi:hypothetical protein
MQHVMQWNLIRVLFYWDEIFNMRKCNREEFGKPIIMRREEKHFAVKMECEFENDGNTISSATNVDYLSKLKPSYFHAPLADAVRAAAAAEAADDVADDGRRVFLATLDDAPEAVERVSHCGCCDARC